MFIRHLFWHLLKILVAVQQINKLDIALEVRVLVTELHHHSAQLEIFGLSHVRYEAHQPECLLLGLAERGIFVEGWVLK
jgi:hypothetical protein